MDDQFMTKRIIDDDEAESSIDEVAENLLEATCGAAHDVLHDSNLPHDSDTYDALLQALAHKIHEYTDLPGEGYNPDYKKLT